MPDKSDKTHIEGTTNFIEIQPPGSDYLSTVLRVEDPVNDGFFTSFYDMFLDSVKGPAIECLE